MSKPVRTALLGGTFNPLHNGHLAIAESVLEQGLADEVWILITPCNPWKAGQQLLDDHIRYEMVAEAVKDLEHVYASDYEFRLPMPSYTANTLKSLTSDYPDREFILTIGADNWAKFGNWRESDYIRNNFRLIVYPREGYNTGTIPDGVSLLNLPLLDYSSTRIRQMVKDGVPLKEMVPASVARTISELHLYCQ